MSFNSYIFVLVFLPLTVIVSHLLGKTKHVISRKIAILIFSLVFVAYADRNACIFFLIMSLVDYLYYVLINRSKNEKVQKFIYIFTLIINICSLGYIKYCTFFVDTINKALSKDYNLKYIIVPLGISFVVFHQISFIVYVYKEREKISLLDYLIYVFYFPKYVQGPLTKYSVFKNEINREYVFDSDSFSQAIYFFATGLGFKVLLADIFAKAVNYGYDSFSTVSSLELLIVTLCYTLQIYFDFCGYSRMAVGVSAMLGIKLPDNFDKPYTSTSIIEFWNKWHISLTSFLREYLYYPLGGNRKGKIRTYFNIFIVFLISGIWHGAAWTFIIWGCMHGLAQILNKLFRSLWDKVNVIVRWFATFSFINMAWIFFRAGSRNQAVEIITRIFRMDSTVLSEEFLGHFRLPEIDVICNRSPEFMDFLTTHPCIEALTFILVGLILSLSFDDKWKEDFKPTIMKSILCALVLFASIISFSNVVTFIYANF